MRGVGSIGFDARLGEAMEKVITHDSHAFSHAAIRWPSPRDRAARTGALLPRARRRLYRRRRRRARARGADAGDQARDRNERISAVGAPQRSRRDLGAGASPSPTRRLPTAPEIGSRGYPPPPTPSTYCRRGRARRRVRARAPTRRPETAPHPDSRAFSLLCTGPRTADRVPRRLGAASGRRHAERGPGARPRCHLLAMLQLQLKPKLDCQPST